MCSSDLTARRARDYAEEALATLARQGVVARTEVETTVERAHGFLGIGVRHFDAADIAVYAQKFAVLWAQASRNAPMNFGDRTFLLVA